VRGGNENRASDHVIMDYRGKTSLGGRVLKSQETRIKIVVGSREQEIIMLLGKGPKPFLRQNEEGVLAHWNVQCREKKHRGQGEKRGVALGGRAERGGAESRCA